ncbi:hypothetical protein EV421DRAFT_1800570 [Armillaria borealis]|uniref:Uncharacterized protein n=1 Tax=Armillaria borealis TaxID=47425 RepID=A0AA39MSM7_9AGAR|nr:hypothetical protein EV421DRAFT_1800570 [Armillaria borealis]
MRFFIIRNSNGENMGTPRLLYIQEKLILFFRTLYEYGFALALDLVRGQTRPRFERFVPLFVTFMHTILDCNICIWLDTGGVCTFLDFGILYAYLYRIVYYSVCTTVLMPVSCHRFVGVDTYIKVFRDQREQLFMATSGIGGDN